MTRVLKFYNKLTACSTGILSLLLKHRLKKGKEDVQRLSERMGEPTAPRPAGHLVWFHAASVGEAQSVLILLKTFRATFPDLKFLVTTGTVTSANLMQKRLPEWAIHQYYPLDHPRWVNRFLDHWRPDMAIWIESEIWPNMLMEIKNRQFPVALLNARMSKKSFQRWSLVPNSARALLNVFDLLLAQTENDAKSYRLLGARDVKITDSLKFAADPLPVDDNELNRFDKALETRIGWLYASTHDGEEDIAFKIHTELKANFPTMLTIIVPRDPSRADSIIAKAASYGLSLHQRSRNAAPPDPETDIYLADTFGDLGLFYKISGLACIGRSFSNDGGGGHNPIEAAQLNCAVLHGPKVQNFEEIYKDMNTARAAVRCEDEDELKHTLARLFFNSDNIYHLQNSAHSYVINKAAVLDVIMQEIEPLFVQTGFHCHPPEQRAADKKQACA